MSNRSSTSSPHEIGELIGPREPPHRDRRPDYGVDVESLRWVLLIGTEIVFWGGLAAFFTIRYVADRPDQSRYVIGFVIVEHVALLVFGVVDYLRTGRWESYQTIIAVVLGYMLIWGRSDLAKLDGWIGRRVAARKGTHPERDSGHGK